jgi:V8-like Glu-specific endopeptidase
MPIDPKDFLSNLIKSLNEFDRKTATEMCRELITFLYQTPDPFPTAVSEKILQNLRAKRMFGVMQQVADALITTNRDSLRIRRQYAQSLIDTGNYSAGLCILNSLTADAKNAGADKIAIKEYRESQGLIGRVYKQLYVNASNPANPQKIDYLKRSIKAYNDIYSNNEQDCLWHGVNVLALLHRAKVDGMGLEGYADIKELAEKILTGVEKKYADTDQPADGGDFAIAAEACIALNRPKDALEWLSGYFHDPYVDAFELASTLRQMEEVWRLDMNSEMGKLILPLLRAQLLQKEGGNVLIDPVELKQQKDAEESTTNTYKELLKETNENSTTKSNKGLEKVFGVDSYNSYKWMMTANERGHAVARIGRDSSKGHGTGFLLYGKALHEKWADELILITNEHVVNKDGSGNSLTPYDVVVIFEALNRDEEFSVSEIIWSSPRNELDTTILRFDADNLARLKELTKKVKIYPVAPVLPILTEQLSSSHRVYIIGHPAGGTLQYSIQDNLLLDHQDPKIHYRTPTIGGSSGSPVFNAKWDLIGLHHAGRNDMPKLNEKEGTYEANEGIWIQSIKKALRKFI